MILHEKISEQLPKWRERVRALANEHAEVVVDTVTIGEVVGGMRDTKSLLTDISYVDPAEGIRFRGMTIPEVLILSLDGRRGPDQRTGIGGGSRMGKARGCS